MRDPARIESIISALRGAWYTNPDLRLGQLISNLAAGEPWRGDPFYMEDAYALNELRKMTWRNSGKYPNE